MVQVGPFTGKSCRVIMEELGGGRHRSVQSKNGMLGTRSEIPGVRNGDNTAGKEQEPTEKLPNETHEYEVKPQKKKKVETDESIARSPVREKTHYALVPQTCQLLTS